MMNGNMKKTVCLLIGIMYVSLCLAQTQKVANAVTMVSFEQEWTDREATIALKNNTQEQIHDVTFRITYLDMSGTPMDYKDFTREVDIAPGLTKKVNITAYERNRHYHYYKSEGWERNTGFKVTFELKGYNQKSVASVVQKVIEEPNSPQSSWARFFDNGMGFLPLALFTLFMMGVYVGLYVLVAVMARNRHRSEVGWILVAIFASPLLACIILLFIGDNTRYIDNDRHFDNRHFDNLHGRSPFD